MDKCIKEEAFKIRGCGQSMDGIHKARKCESCEYNNYEVLKKEVSDAD